MLDLQGIKEIIQQFDQSSIYELDIEFQDTKIKLKRKENIITDNSILVNSNLNQVVEKKHNKVNEEKVQGTEVKSPIVGVFYSAPNPDSEIFVKVGTQVKKGDTLCIIEAMKVMNEIPSPIDGEIVKILVSNEDMVEYDQPLFIIK